MTPQSGEVERAAARCMVLKEASNLGLIARRELGERTGELSGAVVLLRARPDPIFAKSCADQSDGLPRRFSTRRATEPRVGNDA